MTYRTRVIDDATQRPLFTSTTLFCWDSIIETAAEWYGVAADQFTLVETDEGDKIAIGYRIVASIVS